MAYKLQAITIYKSESNKNFNSPSPKNLSPKLEKSFSNSRSNLSNCRSPNSRSPNLTTPKLMRGESIFGPSEKEEMEMMAEANHLADKANGKATGKPHKSKKLYKADVSG